MKDQTKGRSLRRFNEVVAGLLTDTFGRPVKAVSIYTDAAPPADGRPLTAGSTSLDEGMPVEPVSYYSNGTLFTSDGRPVAAVVLFDALGAPIGGGGLTYDAAIEPVYIFYDAGYNPVSTYPIAFTLGWPPEALPTDQLRVIVRATPANTIVLDQTITPGAGPITVPGLSAITTGSHSIEAIRIVGTSYGDGSNVLNHGPDNVAPVLTAPTGVAVDHDTATIGVTTDTAEGTLYRLVNTSPTATLAAVKAGTSSAVTASGVQSFTVESLTPFTTYYAHFAHTDATLNDSAVASSASFTTSAAPAAAAKLVANAPAGNANQSQYVTVDSTRFDVIGEAGVGAPCLVRSTDAPPTDAHFEVTIIAAAADGGGFLYLGFCDAAEALGPAVYPNIGTAVPGVMLRPVVGEGGLGAAMSVYRNGAQVGTVELPTAVAVSHVFAFDRQGNDITIRCKQGSTITTLAAFTLTSQVPSNWTAFVGSGGTSGQLHTNFGAEAFAIAPLGTCSGW